MVTTLTLPSSALGFTLDSNNQYIISVTLVMKEIIKMVASLNSSVSLYLRHHNIKYKYTFYINGTAWKSSNGYINLTNTNVSFSNENISGYLSSSSLKQTLSCTVEISHPQFYCKLNSENYTFVTINKKPQELKAKNVSTGQYETIGLSFSNLSSSEKSGIDSIRWPLFNTENSSQQFVIPIGSASYTRRNGSIRAERFGGSAGQYFNLDTNPSSNKDYRANNGTEYRYVDSFTPALRYYTSYSYLRTHYYTTTSSSEWASPTRATPTLTTGENETGRYTSYAFGGWSRSYNFRIDYFTEQRIYAPNKHSVDLEFEPSPKYENLPNSAFGLRFYTSDFFNDYCAEVLGRDFTVSYTNAEKYENSTTWPAYESFITGGSVTLGGESKYAYEFTFDYWRFVEGTLSYYYCRGTYPGQTYFPDTLDRSYKYYSNAFVGPTDTPGAYPPGSAAIPAPRYVYVHGALRYYSVERYYYVYAADRSYTGREYYYETDGTKNTWLEKWTAVYSQRYLSYDWYLYTTYTTISSTITGTVSGNEYVYKNWWDYETRTNWYIDSNNNIQYYNNYQVKITNDTNSYRTS